MEISNHTLCNTTSEVHHKDITFKTTSKAANKRPTDEVDDDLWQRMLRVNSTQKSDLKVNFCTPLSWTKEGKTWMYLKKKDDLRSSCFRIRTKEISKRHAKYILYPTPQQWDYISCDYNKDMMERKIYSRHWWFCTKEFLIMANKKIYHHFIVTPVMHYAQLIEEASWVILWIIIKYTT